MSTEKVCSICASKTHTWKECVSNYKKCINCNGEHSALNKSCPSRKIEVSVIRKDIVTKKKEKVIQRQEQNLNFISSATKSYANATKGNLEGSTSKPEVIKNQTVESTTCNNNVFGCLLYSHMMNMANPGSFTEELKILLEANSLQPMKIPKCPTAEESLKIIQLQSNTPSQQKQEIREPSKSKKVIQPETINVPSGNKEEVNSRGTHNEKDSNEPVSHKKEKNTDKSKKRRQDSNGKIITKDNEIREEELMEVDNFRKVTTSSSSNKKKNMLTCKELEATIYYPEYPHLDSKQSLEMAWTKNETKITFSNMSYSENELLRIVANKEIDYSDALYEMVTQTSFNKIRTGLTPRSSSPIGPAPTKQRTN